MAVFKMAPNSSSTTTVTQTVSEENGPLTTSGGVKDKEESDINSNILNTSSASAEDANSNPSKGLTDPNYDLEIVWRNVLKLSFLHLGGLYGGILWLFYIKWSTLVFMVILSICSGLGITAGAHRLWSHRTYKAKLQLRILLAMFNLISCQNDIYDWSRDHRVHHKYSETDADPYNVNRGFFFSHVGWLMVKKHPEVVKRGKAIDLADLRADPVVMFQRRFYYPLTVLVGFILPTMIPYYAFGEPFVNSFFVCSMLRYAFTLNMTWLVNSAAHMWGNKPYDQYLTARQNRFVALGALGEGFHNYHHTFPWDYATSELGWTLNPTTIFIDAMAAIGWAYDRKTVSMEHIRQRMERTGDQSLHHHHHSH